MRRVTSLARCSDPSSSRAAAAEVVSSGRRQKQMDVVLSLLAKRTNVTSAELAYHCGLDRYMVARRLPDLESLGLVKRGAMRRCSVGERRCVTWRLR